MSEQTIEVMSQEALRERQDDTEQTPISSRAFGGAWRKGWIAGYTGKTKRSLYYTGAVGVNITYGRAFANYWEAGWYIGHIVKSFSKSGDGE